MMDRLLRNNTVVKIVASILAILLWLIVHSGEEGTTTGGGITQITQPLRDQSVSVLYDDHNFSLVAEPKVTLTLRGPGFDVMNVIAQSDSVHVIADATKLSEGTHEVPVYVTGLPSGVTSNSPTVTIQLEANVVKDFPITLNTEGKPKEGLNVGEAVISPKTVVLSGAKSVVNNVKSVVATISVEGAVEAVHTSVPLVALDEAGKAIKNVRLNSDRAEVTIPVNHPSKSLPLSLQFKGDLAPGYAVESINHTMTVTAYGDPKTLEALESYPVPVLDLTGLNKTTTQKIKLPIQAGITTLEPAEVEITITVVDANRRTFDGMPVKVTGLKEGQSYKVVGGPEQVSVTIEGAKSLLDKLQPSDLQVYVDAANQAAGTHEVRLQITVPNFLRAVQMQPETMMVSFVK
ncbi:CdaR family protein [Tumebacillus permanentifrigoris]|uniref:YbbR domain-containing protein n=1 Tax=Tumebacillus permanentifrigoris TaxID=378543 RepID=A0A316DDQ2_9BACL|nr:CdaR family protein [Tumebacillus permanentifrigoris]PWK16154.1 YbbR domain-containing protein [Tumebacillus permanentifrigoris]